MAELEAEEAAAAAAAAKRKASTPPSPFDPRVSPHKQGKEQREVAVIVVDHGSKVTSYTPTDYSLMYKILIDSICVVDFHGSKVAS